MSLLVDPRSSNFCDALVARIMRPMLLVPGQIVVKVNITQLAIRFIAFLSFFAHDMQ